VWTVVRACVCVCEIESSHSRIGSFTAAYIDDWTTRRDNHTLAWAGGTFEIVCCVSCVFVYLKCQQHYPMCWIQMRIRRIRVFWIGTHSTPGSAPILTICACVRVCEYARVCVCRVFVFVCACVRICVCPCVYHVNVFTFWEIDRYLAPKISEFQLLL